MDGNTSTRDLCAALSFPHPVPVQVEIRPRRGGNAPDFEARLVRIASALARASPAALRVGGDEGPEPPARPALTLVGAELPPIHYLALPEGPEAAPFVEALSMLAAGVRPSSAPRPAGEPAEIMVLVAPGCPNCPRAVRAALSLLSAGPPVCLAVVDVTAFPGLVEPFKPRSVPVTVLDRRVRVVGVVPPARLGRLLLPAGAPERDREVLATLLENGLLVEAAEELERPSGVEAFVALWSGSTLQTRMGLMMAADELLDRDRRGLDLAVPPLRAALVPGDRARRGDTAELLGKIGSQAAREALATVVDDPDEEVAEAAREALASCRSEET